MGYASSLRIPEFRSLELVLDDICKGIMPPIVRSLDVVGRPANFGGVPGILYVPRHETPEGFVLYLHGGGYIGTSPNMYAFFTAQVCRQTGCAVFVADYRLAPEFPYPAAAEDASAIYAELIARGIPHERIFLAGDSGGGGLANTVLLEDPERIRPVRPAGLLLFSPEVDLRLDEPSVTENADHDILPWNIPTTAYLHGADVSSSPVSPLERGPQRFPSDLCHLGRLRDVPRPHTALRRLSPRRRGPHIRTGVRRDVPRLRNPDALGRQQPRGVRTRAPIH